MLYALKHNIEDTFLSYVWYKVKSLWFMDCGWALGSRDEILFNTAD